MRLSQSIKACRICLPVAFVIIGCGGGGGEPGSSPHLDNTADTKLHPEAYVERWWPGCPDSASCMPVASR